MLQHFLTLTKEIRIISHQAECPKLMLLQNKNFEFKNKTNTNKTIMNQNNKIQQYFLVQLPLP